jgi:hypothetical protein
MTERPISIMIIDDHVVIRSGLRMLIEHDQQMRVIAMAGNEVEALGFDWRAKSRCAPACDPARRDGHRAQGTRGGSVVEGHQESLRG